jgi:hypothetical protein
MKNTRKINSYLSSVTNFARKFVHLKQIVVMAKCRNQVVSIPVSGRSRFRSWPGDPLRFSVNIHRPDDEGRTHFWNVGLLERDYKAPYPRKLPSLCKRNYLNEKCGSWAPLMCKHSLITAPLPTKTVTRLLPIRPGHEYPLTVSGYPGDRQTGEIESYDMKTEVNIIHHQ